jgi:glutamine synthetase
VASQKGKASRKRSARSRAGGVSPTQELVARLERDGFTNAKIGGFDLDGVLRGKYVSLDKLASALRSGFGFCDVIFGWDMADVVYEGGLLTGPQTGYPDVLAQLDVSTVRSIPWEPGVVSLLCDFHRPDGTDHPGCPRSLLKRIIERAERQGLSAKVGAEYEFFFFQETRDSLVDKGFRGLRPLDPGMFGYSWVRTGQDAELMRDLLTSLRGFDINVEGLHTETGPGVYEAAIRYDDALLAADQAALLKTAVKQIAHRHGLAVTFMAKASAELPGCSGHLHESLWQDGKNAFHDARSRSGMSKVMKHFIAGQLSLMQELTAMYAPTVNSYKRYTPGVWAPLVASWGHENRNCAVRVIGTDSPTSLRVEYRQPGADMNPYVAMAASLGAGLWGIEKQLALGPETLGDPGEGGPGAIPRTLAEAAERLSKSRAARQLFGAEFVDHYVMTRRWEVRQFEKAVTDWELARYFETV